MLTQTLVRSRGWSLAMIHEFLGSPDELGNSQYTHSGFSNLYDFARVEAAEQTPEFILARARYQKRRARAAKGLVTRAKFVLRHVRGFDLDAIALGRITPEELSNRSIDYYNLLHCEERKYVPPGSSKELLDSIMRDYLRHQLSPYSEALDLLYETEEKDAAYYSTRDRISAAVNEIMERVYAALEQEKAAELQLSEYEKRLRPYKRFRMNHEY